MSERVQLHQYQFTGLEGIVTAGSRAEVSAALEQLEQATARGLHAAGFISYEAAAGLETNLTTHVPGTFPLLWFGLFRERIRCTPFTTTPTPTEADYNTSGWALSLTEEAYIPIATRIQQYIAQGDSYQVNFTLRQRFKFSGDPLAYYADLCRAQPTPYSAYIDTGSSRMLSASPELFFALKDGILTTRPMKGTVKRGRWWQEDQEYKTKLRESPKERAENLMIVDMLRNDMGMIAKTGSVKVASLFDVETLGTVHQMTSTITAELKEGIGLVELFQALFPCGSVTGAPKRRTMEIIAELEDTPRGVYTGCIGYLSPGNEALFSVAIRTMVIDTTGAGEMGIGSGITCGSSPVDEYAECLAKGLFARQRPREFQLIESLLFEEGTGYFLLERHLERLCRSADYFAFLFDPDKTREVLVDAVVGLTGTQKIRLTLGRSGDLECTASPLGSEPGKVRIDFARQPVDSANPFLYHKTTRRELYEAEATQRPDCADIIFCNERGEVTEGTISNVVVRLAGELVTPPLASGLLPGVFREELLARGKIREQVFGREELAGAEEVYLINSVRKWRRVTDVGQASSK
jgi:para-aminobenzoate synthetase/4-amino-4-deoxychorismate lyase